MNHSLRIALLSYRGNPFSGGQGVYVRNLSRALAELGHRVEVFSGQPYPELDEGVHLTRVPSLDLYRSDDPFRTPKLHEFRDGVDVLEFASMCTAAFPEPLTFSLRMARILRERAGEFDVIHDNQSLGYGLLAAQRRLPVVATIHHPCSIDLQIELQHAATRHRRWSLRRWYSFTKMQARVARRLSRLITVSELARDDAVREFGVDPTRLRVVNNGVDTETFRPLDSARKPGTIVTTASADAPLKGLAVLIEAVAKLRTERDVELLVVGKEPRRGPARDALDRLGVGGSVSFVAGISTERLVQLYSEAQVAVVPSLYEGFSLPALEAMACGVPLVATRVGALPEIVGDREAGLLVAPNDPGALALAVETVLDDEPLARRLGDAGRRRVLESFSWSAAAEATVEIYREAIGAC